MTNTPKVLNVFIVAIDFSGVKTYVNELSKYFYGNDKVNLFIIFLAMPNYKEMAISKCSNITTIHVPDKISKEINIKYFRRVVLLLYYKFKDLETVIFHFNSYEQYYFAEEVKKTFRCPIIFTLHFLKDFYSYMDRLSCLIQFHEDLLFENILKLSDHVICVTNFAQRILNNVHNVSELNTSVIFNGLCDRKSTFSHNEIINLRQKLGFNFDDQLILYAGLLQERKGIDILLKGFDLLKYNYPRLKLIIIGTGDYDQYLSLIGDNYGRICFTGQLSKSTLYDFYTISDIGIIPSRYEQCSYVALEMMQAQLPLIISDVPGLNELIKHMETGLTFKTSSKNNIKCNLELDPTDLALQIQILLNDKNLAIKLANKAYSHYCNQLTGCSMGVKTLRIYNKLILNN